MICHIEDKADWKKELGDNLNEFRVESRLHEYIGKVRDPGRVSDGIQRELKAIKDMGVNEYKDAKIHI